MLSWSFQGDDRSTIQPSVVNLFLLSGVMSLLTNFFKRMKYVITGSIGHISKPIVQQLVAKNHRVTVITSSTDRVKDIEALGTEAAVGSVEDASFVSRAFEGADAVYLMIPPNWSPQGGWYEYQQKVADIFVQAIQTGKVKFVVLLSSVGAHMRKGAGPVDGLGYAEERLESLKDVQVKVLRPSYFYYNLFSMIPLIKNMNIMGSNFGGTDEKLVLTDTSDIAEVASNHLSKLDFKGFSVEYIGSDERHPNEIAKVLGDAIGKPGIPWVQFPDDQSLQGMLQAGLAEPIAKGYTQLGIALREGAMQASYWKNRPALGKVKLEDFAQQFASVYQKA
jgi:uncharacterized protein YbjT (DUF2867 family)